MYVYGKKNKYGSWDLQICRTVQLQQLSTHISILSWIHFARDSKDENLSRYDFIKHSFILGSFGASDALLDYTEIR